jgi:hypothetical protein
MFGNRDPRHVVAGGKRDQGLAVPGEQRIKQCPPRWVGESPKHCLHTDRIGNQMVSCQPPAGQCVLLEWTQTDS